MNSPDRNTYDLSAASIELISADVEAFMMDHGVSKKDTLKIKMMLEEALLNYSERFSKHTAVRLKIYAVLGTIRASLRVEGECCNPFRKDVISDRSIMGVLMDSEEAARVSWKYKIYYNEIVFTARRERLLSNIARIGLGILFGVIFGCGMLLIPEEAARKIVDGCITPVTGAFTGLLCVMAAPMCFFAIVLGIVHMGDLSAVGKIAKKMAGRLFMTALFVALIGTLSAASQLYFADIVKRFFSLQKLLEILVGFLPNNILSPLLNFNAVQIIVLGVMFGASLLTIGHSGDNVVELIETLNNVAVTCNAVYLNRFIPYYVALTVLGIIGARQLEVAPGLLYLGFFILLGELLIVVYFTFKVYVRLGIPMKVFLKKNTPPFMIALSSASFGAAFVENINSLLALGVEPEYAALCYNVGGIIFRPGECIIYMLSSLYTASLFKIEISSGWLVTAFVLSFILSIATPPVPGGTAVSLAVLFSQLGFSESALSFIIPMSMVLEFPTVAIDAFCAKCQTLMLAEPAGKIDLARARSL